MVHYGLAKVLRGVEALQTCKKSANGFGNLLLQGLANHSALLLLLLHNQLDVRENEKSSFSRVLPTSQMGYHVGKPIESVVYCFYNINLSFL